jgi:hypothetical protein
MSLEAIAAGAFALRGLSILAQLVRGSQAPQAAEDLRSAEQLTEDEFQALLDQVLGIARQDQDGEPAVEPQGIQALIDGERALAPLLFRALDADDSGTLEGGELDRLRGVVDQIAEVLSPQAADEVHDAVALAT